MSRRFTLLLVIVVIAILNVAFQKMAITNSHSRHDTFRQILKRKWTQQRVLPQIRDQTLSLYPSTKRVMATSLTTTSRTRTSRLRDSITLVPNSQICLTSGSKMTSGRPRRRPMGRCYCSTLTGTSATGLKSG
jgi:hypothetical protein